MDDRNERQHLWASGDIMVLGMEDLLMFVLVPSTGRVYRLLYMELDLRKKTYFCINSDLQTHSKA